MSLTKMDIAMTQEDRALLLKDLCARLPYGVKVSIRSDYTGTLETMELNCFHLDSTYSIEYRMLRPYLRPMSTMTEEEREEYTSITHSQNWLIIGEADKYVDWLNAHHFDYRGLIEKGLALEAPEDMYKTE